MSPRELAVQSKPIELMTVADAIRLDLAMGDAGYRQAGSKFIKQKAALKGEKGAWTAWLEAEGFQERTARRYMAYSKTDSTVRFADYLYEHGSANQQEPSPPQPTVPPTKVPITTESLPAVQPDDGDVVEPLDETIQVLAETEPPVTKKNTVKAPANEQPAPKPGSRAWVEEQIEAICEASHGLERFYPKITVGQWERIRVAQEALGHVVRIGTNFDNVDRGSRELVELWNRQHGYQLEGEHFAKYGMLKVREAIGCEPDIRRWARLIKKMAEVDSSWVTVENFEYLTSTWGGRPYGLEDLEKQEDLLAWDPAVPEAPGNTAAAEPEP